MTDIPQDHTVAQTAEKNIPTQSNPMDNIHGNTEDISNKASGYKVCTFHPTSLSNLHFTCLAYALILPSSPFQFKKSSQNLPSDYH